MTYVNKTYTESKRVTFYALLMSNIDKFNVVSPLSVRREIVRRLESGLKLNANFEEHG